MRALLGHFRPRGVADLEIKCPEFGPLPRPGGEAWKEKWIMVEFCTCGDLANPDQKVAKETILPTKEKDIVIRKGKAEEE